MPKLGSAAGLISGNQQNTTSSVKHITIYLFDLIASHNKSKRQTAFFEVAEKKPHC